MRRVVVGMLLVLVVFSRSMGAEETNRSETLLPRLQAPTAAPGPILKVAAHEAAKLRMSGTGLAVQSPQGSRRSWAARHPVLTGLLIGAGAGAIVTVATCGDRELFFAGECLVIGAGLGGGLGAGAGALIGLTF